MPTNPSFPQFKNVPRRLTKQYQAAADDFAADVGKVIWAWNYSHAAFAMLFNSIVAGHAVFGYSMWHSQRSDAGQRDLLKAIADDKFAGDKMMLRRIQWSLKTAGMLSSLRNDAAHMATAWTANRDNPTIIPDAMATAPVRFRRIHSHDDFEKLLSHLRGDLVVLAHFVYMLNAVILLPNGQYPLPRKPKLLSIQAPPMGRKKTRRGKGKAPQRPPRSSQA